MSTESRLLRLERANRNLRWTVAVILLAIFGFSSWRERSLPAAPAEEKVTKVLNVERLNIMASDGTVAAYLTGGKGTATFKMGPLGTGVSPTSFPNGSSVLSLDDGEKTVLLGPSVVSLCRRSASAVKDRERTLRRITSGEKGIPDEDLTRTFSSPPGTVLLETTDTGVCGLLLRNQFGKDAVSIQVNKANVGAIYLGDVNGKVTRPITGD